MRKIYFLISAIIVIILSLNAYYYFDIYDQQVAFQKRFLLKQTQLYGEEIEKVGSQFVSDLNRILFLNDITQFFDNEEIMQRGAKNLEIFYSKYDNLIKNILLYDNKKNVFNLYKDNNNNFISDTYTTHDQRELVPQEKISIEKNKDVFFLPIINNNFVTGNIAATIDYIHYINSVFEKSHLENTQWQWLVNNKGEIILNNFSGGELQINQLLHITDDLIEGLQGALTHSVLINDKDEKVISAYYPIQILDREFGIVFTLKTETILQTIIKNATIIVFLTLILVSSIIFIFHFFIRRQNIEAEKLQESELALVQILESLPIGILMLGKDRKIRKINNTAIEMFSLEKEGDLVGKDISDRFSFEKNFLYKEYFGLTFDTSQFFSYEKNGKEIVIYEKEILFKLEGEDITLQAFVDVTTLEKARKQEVVANQAKSEFLAKMSHEIRTPLNGIVGMADAFLHQKLTKKQNESAQIIKQSADLLLSIINDILDFSKIEAGKMMLEEIPFSLSKELDYALNTFNPDLQEKNLDFILRIEPNVPDKIIGDPFRLRQVLSNLVVNAIKFTEKGKITVIVKLVEEYSGNLTIQIDVEDTGIGIPEKQLKGIFGSFKQADDSTIRKYGGAGLSTTISKQLIELMGGEIWVKSPSGISDDPETPGTRFSFTIKVFSNEKIKKCIQDEKITKYHQIKTMIINEKTGKDDHLLEILQNFGISSYVTNFQDKTIDLIKSNIANRTESYNVIIINDTPSFNGFEVARQLHQHKLSDKFLILIVSSNNQKGNFTKCKKLGVDYYLIQPYQSSEVFDIFQTNFPNIKLDEDKTPEVDIIKKDLKILVAEDNLINQQVAKTIFKNLGFEIDMAENGNDAIAKINDNNYDVIFMDIMMPELDGMEATKKLRKQNHNLPIIALTADINKEVQDKMKEVGMNDFIAKPIRVDEIKRVLIKWFSESIKSD
ncbi:MAG: response regulator [Bacteroidales bacterium]|nr:response regulator [Bacteroidales bacterium]